MGAYYKIKASKPDDGYLVSCDLKDPEATRFEIAYYVKALGFTSYQYFTSLSEAESVLFMMNVAWEEGRKEAFKDLRNLIGASE